MGYDAGILQDAHAPVWGLPAELPDWGGDDWRKPVDPTHWIKYSVFWYSQQIGEKLGLARLQQYTTAFGYGNQDVPATRKNNGTQGAWHVSSLRVSPLEQLDFLRRLARRQLPVKPQACDMAEILFDAGVDADGWKIHGKTGTGSPGSFAGDYDREHAYGWRLGPQEAVASWFARLIQDEKAARPNAGMTARASNCWPGCRAGWARPDSWCRDDRSRARCADRTCRVACPFCWCCHHFNIPHSLKDTGLAALLGWLFCTRARAQRQLWRDDVLRGVGFDHAQRAGQMGRADRIRPGAFYALRAARILPCLLLALLTVDALAPAGVPIFGNRRTRPCRCGRSMPPR